MAAFALHFFSAHTVRQELPVLLITLSSDVASNKIGFKESKYVSRSTVVSWLSVAVRDKCGPRFLVLTSSKPIGTFCKLKLDRNGNARMHLPLKGDSGVC